MSTFKRILTRSDEFCVGAYITFESVLKEIPLHLLQDELSKRQKDQAFKEETPVVQMQPDAEPTLENLVYKVLEKSEQFHKVSRKVMMRLAEMVFKHISEEDVEAECYDYVLDEFESILHEEAYDAFEEAREKLTHEQLLERLKV